MFFSLMIYRKQRKSDRQRRSIMHLTFDYDACRVLVILLKLALKWKWVRPKDATGSFSFVVYRHDV